MGPDLALIATAAGWGLTFPLVREGIQGIGSLAFLQARFLLAALLLAPVVWKRSGGRGVMDRRAVAPGLLLALGFVFQTEGLRTVGPSVSAFLTGTSVILVPILAGLLGWESTSRRRAAAAAVALLGIFLLQGRRPPQAWTPGETWTLLCAVAFAGHIVVLGRVAAPSRAATPLAFGQLAVAAAAVLVAGSLRGETFANADWSGPALRALLFTAVAGTAAAYLVQTWAQARVPAGHAAVCFATEPVFAALFSAVFYADRLSPGAWAGAAVVLAATALVLTERGPGRGATPASARRDR